MLKPPTSFCLVLHHALLQDMDRFQLVVVIVPWCDELWRLVWMQQTKELSIIKYQEKLIPFSEYHEYTQGTPKMKRSSTFWVSSWDILGFSSWRPFFHAPGGSFLSIEVQRPGSADVPRLAEDVQFPQWIMGNPLN